MKRILRGAQHPEVIAARDGVERFIREWKSGLRDWSAALAALTASG